jgi:hypothetical protein
MCSLLLACLLVTAEGPPADAAIVAPRELLPALAPLVEQRERQGHRFASIASSGTASAIREAIGQVAARGSLKYVLLVGDVGRGPPAHQVGAVVNVRWGSEREIASDNAYGDLDDDDVPDVAVGRLAADTPAELEAVVAKILAYERSADFGSWRQRVNIVAGVGGFNPLLDTVIESATSRLLTSGIPQEYDTRVTYGSWRSPYCPDPRLFHAATVERHNEGCLFWVYVGHGQARELDRVSIPGERFHIFDVDDCAKLHSRSGSPIALLMACYAGAFDQPLDCLAEEMLKADGGPVAVYAGSRVTMPYGMGVMGSCLMSEYFRHQHQTLGDVILAAKQRMMRPIDDPENPASLNRVLLEGAAAVMSPDKSQLEAERREHLHLFNLLGDPMLKLNYPRPVTLSASRQVQAGQRLRIEGRSTVAGRAVLELMCGRDCHKQPTPVRDRYDPADKALAAFQPTYEQSLDRCWGRWSMSVPAGEFATEIEVPRQSAGPCQLRLLVANDVGHAAGATSVQVEQPESQTVGSGPARR